MAFSGRNILLAGFAALLLALPPLYALARLGDDTADAPAGVIERYLEYLYARDFRQAYRFIASEDQRLKRQDVYVRERGPFHGFTQDVARQLAELIEVRTVTEQSDGSLNRVRVALKAPNGGEIAPLVHNWDETRLNALSMPERKKILATLESLARADKLPVIEGEEEYVLVKEGSQWKVFLNWAAGVQVNFATNLPGDGNGAIAAEPVTKGTVARSGDVFIVGFKVRNLAAHEIRTRIAHRIEPKELAEYLDLVECALLLPVRIRPGEEQIYNSTYLVRGDLPDGIKALNVTYDFKIEG
jgi:hypothetical protein